MYFLVVTRRTERFDPTQATAHQQFLSRLRQCGAIRMSGPFADGGGGGAYVIEADNLDAAHTLAQEDPMVAGGSLDMTVREWAIRYINLPAGIGTQA